MTVNTTDGRSLELAAGEFAATKLEQLVTRMEEVGLAARRTEPQDVLRVGDPAISRIEDSLRQSSSSSSAVFELLVQEGAEDIAWSIGLAIEAFPKYKSLVEASEFSAHTKDKLVEAYVKECSVGLSRDLSAQVNHALGVGPQALEHHL